MSCGFVNYVTTKAIACEEFCPLQSLKPFQGHPKGPSTTRNQKGDKERHDNNRKQHGTRESNKEKARKETTKHNTSHDEKDSKQDVDKRPTLPQCLSTATCPGKRHRIKDCPETPDDEKREFLRQYHAEKEKKNLSLLSSESLETQSITEAKENGRLAGKLFDKVTVVLNRDYGADHAAMSQHHIDMCTASGIDSEILPVSPAISFKLAVGNGQEILKTTDKKFRITTTVDTP